MTFANPAPILAARDKPPRRAGAGSGDLSRHIGVSQQLCAPIRNAENSAIGAST